MGKEKVLLSTLTVLLLITISSLISNSMAVLVFSLFIFLIGHIYTNTIENKNRDNAVYLFNIVLSALVVLATFHYLDTVVDYKAFAVDWRDEYKFWIMSNNLSELNSISEVFKESYNNWIYGGYPGYVFYIGSIGYIAESLFDGNHLLLQFMGSVLWGALTSLVLYRTFLIYFDKSKAFKNVLFFSIFSVVFALSFKFLRDIIITFFYTWTFYIILKKYSVGGVLRLLLIALIVWQLRFEHGLFILVFAVYYIYKRFRSNKFILFSSVLAMSLILIYFINDFFVTAIGTLEMYESFTETEALGVEDSLGKYIFKLPSPIKELARFLNSQLQPFPPWNSLINSTNIYQIVVNITPIIYSLFWFIVIFSLVKWTIFRKMYKVLSPPMIILSLIVLMFLFVVTMGSGTIRRIMCVYPFVYLIYCLFKSKIYSKSELSNTKKQAFMTYIFMISIYLFLKGVF